MLRTIRASHHGVVAYLALFFALGGTAIAAKPLITGADVQDGSLTGIDVQDGSLGGDDVNESSLGKVPSAATADSATSAGVRGQTTVYSSVSGSPIGNQALATCPPGKILVGGGYGLGGADRGVIVKVNGPGSVDPANRTWYVSAVEEEPQDDVWSLTAYAICVDG